MSADTVATDPVIFWFRRDWRVADNPALIAAVRAGRGRVVAAFVVDSTLAGPAGPARVAYMRATIESLNQSLGDRLCIRVGDPARALADLARSVGARAVYATADHGPRGRERDAQVAASLGAAGIATAYIDSNYVVAPGTVLAASGSPCRVFSAFRRRWELEAAPTPLAAPRDVRWIAGPTESLDALTRASSTKRPWYFGDLPDQPRAIVTRAGENAAHEQLRAFSSRVDQYDDSRNRPALDATSRLSAHLRFGTLHPRQVLDAVAGLSTGRRTFESEICWREFYADVLFHHPDSVRRVLQPALEHLRVDRDERAATLFQAWARGETGYPLVDAGMRQLLEEGWMHNRVRMVAASFLVKHLHLDWRWGAKWFMWRLIDGDLASNQHGWQWTAGTGTDAAPFHRIFNPTLQGERFDPDGLYVRRYVAELAHVPAPHCLQPGGGVGETGGYGPPIIDASSERREALARFAEARARARGAP